MLSLKNGILFVHIPRTSGTSVEVSVKGCPEPDDFKHYTSSMYKKTLGRQLFDSIYKFSIVRNPFDLVVSLYHSKHYEEVGAISGQPLSYFLKHYRDIFPSHEYGVTQCDYLREDMDLIIRFEDRGKGLDQLYQETGVRVDPEVQERATIRNGKPYYKCYTEADKQKVYEIYKEDFERFNYSWKGRN